MFYLRLVGPYKADMAALVETCIVVFRSFMSVKIIKFYGSALHRQNSLSLNKTPISLEEIRSSTLKQANNDCTIEPHDLKACEIVLPLPFRPVANPSAKITE